ncbi:hypothetical protein CRYUN_Cryun01aG0049800 [Craigia yunnanensis]
MGEMESGPSFSCVECGFYLDKQCAEAPSEMKHPFHSNHSFNLLKRKTYEGTCFCDFCDQTCENFVYHCFCNLDLHIKCALFSYNIAEKRIAGFQHISCIDPLISTENRTEKLQNAECFACWMPLLDSVYFSPDCGFYLHAKCVDLPAEINHVLHHQHPLILQFNSNVSLARYAKSLRIGDLFIVVHHLLKDEGLPCHICQENNHKQILYCCSICKFALHIDCASTPPIIEDKSHQHPVHPVLETCLIHLDSCGTPGNYASYICSTCSLIVHKKCISLPRTLKHPRHPEHPICHTYFLGQYEFESWECRNCHLDEVKSEHGGYCCPDCNYIVHANCAIEDYNWYKFDESGRIDENLEENSASPPYSIIETKYGENVLATEIEHFSHKHNLVLM